MGKYAKWFRIILISVGVIIVISLSYTTHLANVKNLAYNFNGRVGFVSYDEKREATVFINDTDYYLSYPNWDFDHDTIKVGDSMIKKRGSWVIKLIHRNGRITTEGDEKP